jgi:hypothetical protein
VSEGDKPERRRFTFPDTVWVRLKEVVEIGLDADASSAAAGSRFDQLQALKTSGHVLEMNRAIRNEATGEISVDLSVPAILGICTALTFARVAEAVQARVNMVNLPPDPVLEGVHEGLRSEAMRLETDYARQQGRSYPLPQVDYLPPVLHY